MIENKSRFLNFLIVLTVILSVPMIAYIAVGVWGCIVFDAVPKAWVVFGFLIAVILAVIFALIYVCVRYYKKHRGEIVEYREERASERYAQRIRRKKEREQIKSERENERIRNRTAVNAILIDTYVSYKKNGLSAATRGLVGGLFLGEFGAAVGINSAKSYATNPTAIFSVTYASGRIGVETVSVGSKRFNELMALANR